jgi:GrpB-like predicted nucleotidyltransferase (UPF0157 family)
VIEVVEYDEAWPLWFEQLRVRYRRLLADLAVVGIEHVGSTSVPGLAAKPVIDVDIVVERNDVRAALAALVAAGFESRGDLGVVDRYAVQLADDPIRTNTYVIVRGSLSLRNHLAVRDELRSNPLLRDEYGALKRRLASETGDIDDYVGRKSPLLQHILERAGFTEAELADVARANVPNA